MRVTASAAVAIALLGLAFAAGCAAPTATGAGARREGRVGARRERGPAAVRCARGKRRRRARGRHQADGRRSARQVNRRAAGAPPPVPAQRHRAARADARLPPGAPAAARAVELLLSLSRPAGKLQMLSALGSALDEAGDNAGAEALLREGLKRNPKAGILYSDLGTTLRLAKRANEALDVYLAGTVAEPAFPGNYPPRGRAVRAERPPGAGAGLRRDVPPARFGSKQQGRRDDGRGLPRSRHTEGRRQEHGRDRHARAQDVGRRSRRRRPAEDAG